MVIKDFKTFESRGDEDADPRQYKLELDDDGNYRTKGTTGPIKEYILGVPSGEVVFVDDKEFKILTDRKIVNYTYSFRGKILNCYCFPDNDIDNIRRFLDEMRPEPPIKNIHTPLAKSMSDVLEDKYQEHLEVRAKDFSDHMMKILHRKHVVACVPNMMGKDYYYLIIPDLKMNTPYYRNKLKDMNEINNKMKRRYPAEFSFTDRLNIFPHHMGKVKYYGLPKGA